jgi:hypothetical protein
MAQNRNPEWFIGEMFFNRQMYYYWRILVNKKLR